MGEIACCAKLQQSIMILEAEGRERHSGQSANVQVYIQRLQKAEAAAKDTLKMYLPASLRRS